MEAHARAPDPLTMDGDIARNWQSWKEDFIIFMKVTGYINRSNEIRANLLKNRIGKVGIDAIQTMSFDNPQDKDDMDILITKLEEYFNPPKKEVIERYNFFKTKKQNESIEQYINTLKEKAKTCNFNDMTDSIIRDKIILDTYDKILRKKFFEADNLDLQKLVMIYNDYNINTEKMKQISKENKIESENSASSKQVINNIRKGCWRCSTVHPQGKCPAWGSKCTNCGDTNHFTHCCKGHCFKNYPKTNDNKVNKNLLDSMAKLKPVSKNNNKWNNQADSEARTTDSINKMTSLPDTPKTSCYTTNSSFDSDVTSDFVMLNVPNTSNSNLRHNNTTTNQSAFLSNSTHYNYTDVKGASARMATNSSNRHEKIYHTTMHESTRQRSNSTFQNNSRSKNTSQFHYTQKYKHDRKKNSDEDNCVLS